jgi:phage tail sheath gpL-like
MIPFKNIPSSQRLPLFYAELDPSMANTAQRPQRTLLIGQKTAAGTLTANMPVQLTSTIDAKALAGPGSVLAGMASAYRANDPNGEAWLLPLQDDAGGNAAAGQIVFNANAGGTSAGVISLYIAGHLVSVPIGANVVATTVVAAVVAAVNANPDLPVIATAAGTIPGSTVTFTAKHKGLLGNDIDLRFNALGATGGEALPNGITVVITALTGGTVNPSLTAALAGVGDMAFDFIVCSLTDTASMTAIAGLLSDQSGRWSPSAQLYGHCFVAYRGTAGASASFASGLNNQHVTCVPFADSPSTSWRWAAAFAGACAVSLRNDPAVPLQYVTVAGIMAPPVASRFTQLIRANTLIYGGCSTWTVNASGQVVTENIITTYMTNVQGTADNSYLEVETLFTLMYVLRFMSDLVSSKYGRVKLAADGVRLLPGSNVVTPSVIKADIIAAYRELEERGMVQQSALFAQNLIVEKGGTNRVNVLWPAILVEQLRVFALLAQFRLS